jgi:hypothetical protein
MSLCELRSFGDRSSTCPINGRTGKPQGHTAASDLRAINNLTRVAVPSSPEGRIALCRRRIDAVNIAYSIAYGNGPEQ